MHDVILVAPAAFKGSLGPRQVAEAISMGARRAMPGASVLQCPISDGGDGLLDAVLPPGSLREHLKVTGPLGDPVSGELGWVDPETAMFESATACGIALLQPDQLDPLRATTRGVGEMIWEAVERGARTVVVGLGGSATVDGGTGAARGLGWSLRDAAGASLPEGGGSLVQLAVLDGGWGLEARVVALADVTTALVGPEGAAPVFGPQKGAGTEGVKLLSRGLERLGELMGRHGRGDLATLPCGGAAGGLGAGPAFVGKARRLRGAAGARSGAGGGAVVSAGVAGSGELMARDGGGGLATLPCGGAAGGLGAGLAFFAKAQLLPGAEWVLSRVGFDAALASAQLVITGEGSFDRTSLVGKASGEVVRRAQAARKKGAVIAGRDEG